ncbi:MAG: amidohydrolase family protein [Defluviitaleaceae bacterium]|nr:amidohydrolase family protein [Defluviitaleaceae bacterium]
MKKFDLHIHDFLDDVTPEAFLSQLSDAGIYGAGVFSPPPPEAPFNGMPYEERISRVLAFCKNYPGRLYPVLWMHAYEDGAVEKAIDAAGRGIAAFKIICNNYYVGDDKSLELMHTIAKVKKPVIFHTGILWDGTASAIYNRPINWECLINVPGLKFATAHCSWPWYDECIALYGKFQHAYSLNPDMSCEMFFDLTPGTPVPYRRDLLTKLFTVGYDVKHNIIFGTDCQTDYNAEWSLKWQNIDNGLYHEIGVDDETVQRIYRDNFLRFLGVTNEVVAKAKLSIDGRK